MNAVYTWFLIIRKQYLKTIDIELTQKAIDPNSKEQRILIMINKQLNYLKYVEKFGGEPNLPGFLMTNQQMLELIYYQTWCKKFQKHTINESPSLSSYIFTCSINNTYSKCINKMDTSFNCLLEHIRLEISLSNLL